VALLTNPLEIWGPPFGVNGEGRNRTGDTTVFSRVLYRLSYLASGGSLAPVPGPFRRKPAVNAQAAGGRSL
jgi:hypothetical protein